MPSFLRKGSTCINRRRYKLALDSWYLNVPTVESDTELDERDYKSLMVHIRYYPSYDFVSHGRPKASRLEIERQITFWMSHLPDNRLMQHLHILATVQIMCSLSGQGRQNPSVNPLSDDLPLIYYSKQTARQFDGSTIVHFVFQRIYRILSNVEPHGMLTTHAHLYLFLGFDDLEHLSGVLTDQYCYVMSREESVISVRDFQYLLGRLYSIILSGVNYRRYRIRLYQNSSFKLNHFVVRIFACLSCETEAAEARLNHRIRLQSFGTLQHYVNPQVR